jgi:hypothetical protein
MNRLKEGAFYSFNVEKETTGPDKSSYYVLSGPGGRKFLLPSIRYSHYGIAVGTNLLCRVDRINCRGEIFIEPPNPFYSEGMEYSFRVNGSEKRVDPSGEEVDVILVSDTFGHLNPVTAARFAKLPEPGTDLKLTVLRISKGRLFLSFDSQERRDILPGNGKHREFTVIKTARDINGQECFVVQERNGARHTIPKRYYEYYGLKEGSLFMGKVVRIRGSGEKIIEPDNPWYKNDSTMECKVEKFETDSVNNTFTVFLTDGYGFTHCIEMKARPESDTIWVRIGKVRKGKPILRPL